jgi:hypothetical protein
MSRPDATRAGRAMTDVYPRPVEPRPDHLGGQRDRPDELRVISTRAVGRLPRRLPQVAGRQAGIEAVQQRAVV